MSDRKNHYKFVSVELTLELYNLVNDAAKRRGMPRSELIRQAIRAFIEQ